jgi:hypothetical protein
MGAPARHREPARSGEAGGPPCNRAQRRRLRRVQGVGPEAYLNGTSQGATPEDARKDAHISGRSRPFMKYPG